MPDVQEYIEQAAVYGTLFRENDDGERFAKARLLARKLHDKEFTIGFAGHFSAGKSSMINALVGTDLLPSGPIPTSANIVKVKKADTDYAIIHQADGESFLYEGKDFSDAIKAFSKDGRSIASVDIGHAGSELPEGITVMDTPGVDSTDDAHRLSTESALHLADLVFYTMDYNHVQSELNFTFTKELMKYNENVYLIINQIDKHRDQELPFDAFKRSVEESFALWGVKPKGIFYTSLRDPANPNNDFPKVKQIVETATREMEGRLAENAGNSLRQLMDEHLRYLNDELMERKNTYSAVVSDEEWEQGAALKEEAEERSQELALLSGDEFALRFANDRQKLLDNATITPFEVRELLTSYLESKSPRFKVGILFGAKKTAEEKARRKKQFFEQLAETVTLQIVTHLKLLMKTSLKNAGLLTDERAIDIDNMELSLPFEEVDAVLPATDTVTGDTVLNVSEQMRGAIHAIYRKMTDPWKEEMTKLAASSGNEKAEPLMQAIRILDEKVAAIGQVDDIKSMIQRTQKEMEAPSPQLLKQADTLQGKWSQKPELKRMEYEASDGEEAGAVTIEDSSSLETDSADHPEESVVIERARFVAAEVEAIPGFLEAADYMRTKADRLTDQEFTVALFGAFSAGKSSFSNALMGDRVLPVSPNPTTAAINRIKPVSGGKEDRTADIHLKTETQMFEDLAFSFGALDIPVGSITEAFDKAPAAIEKDLAEESLHIHKTFIKAFASGYELLGKRLGETFNVPEDEFTKFVANEERSCFVHAIDFYFDCPLTRRGITLVDTPGADSINARHTDVAFEYIRNADAILFITYYNHAFARADREFLIQLGRVKDAFELDKMFFIVNAIDLATDDEEAEAVKSFVAGELTAFGIRHPRVYGISSLKALESKQQGATDPSMGDFETRFFRFLDHDLKGIASTALSEETEKTVSRLAALIDRVETNRSRKAERMQELDRLERDIRERYANGFSEVIERAARSELNELIFYLLQRVFLRYGDFLKEGYSPSVFAKHPADTALKLALEETVAMLGFDISQELKVTNLRMLNFLKKQLKERERIEGRKLAEEDASIQLPPYEPKEADMLSFQQPFSDPSRYRSVNKLFRNQKAFFEKGERVKLGDALEELLKADASDYLGNEKERMDRWAENWIASEAEGLRQHLLNGGLQQIESERSLLSGNEQLEEWRDIYSIIK